MVATGRLLLVIMRTRQIFVIIRGNFILFLGPIIGYTALRMFFPFDLWSNIIIPLWLFVPQIIKNVRNRGVPQIYYSYYFGLLGIQVIEPLYAYSCSSNIYLLEPSILNSLVYSLTYVFLVSLL